LACAATTLRPLFRTFSSHLVATVKGSCESPRKTWPSARSGHIRNGRSNYHGFEENTRARAGSRPDSIISNDAIYLARWVGDSDRGSAEADVVSNSSQSKLKTDEESGLSPADAMSGIRKTVSISTHTVRI
jgi:hypothetical protein